MKEQPPLPLDIAWRRQYDARRYARHLSPSELNQRIRDIFLNLLWVDAGAKISLGPVTKESAIWMEKWTHVLEEMQLRYGPYPAGFTREILHSEPFPNFASDLSKKAANRLSALGLKRGEVFIKFGKREHMESLRASGTLRIQPASYFARTDHGGAIRDDELSIGFSFALSRDDIVKLVRNPQDVPHDAPGQRLDFAFESPTDYWLYCLSNSVEPRLFVDFGADSCVIIRDRLKFSQMLREATQHLPRETVMRGRSALYVDPLLATTHDLPDVPFVKHFRYTYQDEYRFCWLPTTPIQRLAHVDVRIGNMTEISDLVVL